MAEFITLIKRVRNSYCVSLTNSSIMVISIIVFRQEFINLLRTDAMNEFGSRRAQGLVEYGLIIMLVAMIVIVVLWILGPSFANMFSNVITNI